MKTIKILIFAIVLFIASNSKAQYIGFTYQEMKDLNKFSFSYDDGYLNAYMYNCGHWYYYFAGKPLKVVYMTYYPESLDLYLELYNALHEDVHYYNDRGWLTKTGEIIFRSEIVRDLPIPMFITMTADFYEQMTNPNE